MTHLGIGCATQMGIERMTHEGIELMMPMSIERMTHTDYIIAYDTNWHRVYDAYGHREHMTHMGIELMMLTGIEHMKHTGTEHKLRMRA